MFKCQEDFKWCSETFRNYKFESSAFDGKLSVLSVIKSIRDGLGCELLDTLSLSATPDMQAQKLIPTGRGSRGRGRGFGRLPLPTTVSCNYSYSNPNPVKIQSRFYLLLYAQSR